jgi:hypothetical protein
MLTVKYVLEVAGFVLMAAAAAILLNDLYRLYQQSQLILQDQPRPVAIEPRYRAAGRLTTGAVACLLAGLSVQVAPIAYARGSLDAACYRAATVREWTLARTGLQKGTRNGNQLTANR